MKTKFDYDDTLCVHDALFYGSNSWSYTRLGHISDKDEADMTELLSNGDVTITISMG